MRCRLQHNGSAGVADLPLHVLLLLSGFLFVLVSIRPCTQMNASVAVPRAHLRTQKILYCAGAWTQPCLTLLLILKSLDVVHNSIHHVLMEDLVRLSRVGANRVTTQRNAN